MTGTLHLVAVPIGDPDDLTIRARDLLRSVPLVAAEDTRHFATLARHHAITTRATSYHAHNEEQRTPQLLARLAAGDDVALVTDAGMPLVSDPGLTLVRAALAAGHRVTALPGASAVTTALAASGLPPLPFRFIGFPGADDGAPTRRGCGELAGDADTLVVFEAPHRLAATLADALAVLGRSPCLPGAEHDEARRALPARHDLHAPRRGCRRADGARRVHARDRRRGGTAGGAAGNDRCRPAGCERRLGANDGRLPRPAPCDPEAACLRARRRGAR